MSNDSKRYTGTCFCGAVEVSVEGEPAAAGYCHCASCRHWSAGPVNAFTLWSPGQVTITRGADNLASYNKTERSYRKWCKTCGGHVLTDHPGFGLIDVYAAILPDLPFEPKVQVNVEDSVLHVPGELPRFADFPAEMGGTGRMA